MARAVRLKDRIKRGLTSETVQQMAAAAAAAYLWFVFRTTRWQVNEVAKVNQMVTEHQTVIITFWHSRLMMMVHFWPHHLGKNIHVLISHHRDGAFITAVCRWFRLGSVRGSSRRGGAAAAVAGLRKLQAGESLCITPDGPKGPAERAKEGAAMLAAKSGCPLVPTAYALTHRRIARSWDRMLIPLPFGRGSFCVGEPLFIPPEMDEQTASHTLTEALRHVTLRADAALHLRQDKETTA